MVHSTLKAAATAVLLLPRNLSSIWTLSAERGSGKIWFHHISSVMNWLLLGLLTPGVVDTSGTNKVQLESQILFFPEDV